MFHVRLPINSKDNAYGLFFRNEPSKHGLFGVTNLNSDGPTVLFCEIISKTVEIKIQPELIIKFVRLFM